MCLLNTYYMEDTGTSAVKGMHLFKAEMLQSILLVRDDVCRYKDVYICPCAYYTCMFVCFVFKDRTI